MPRPAQMIGHRSSLGGGLAQSPLPYVLSALLVGLILLAVTVLAWLGVRWWETSHAAPAPRVTVLETDVPAAPVTTLDRVYLSTKVANPTDQRVQNMSVELAVVAPDGQVAMRSRQRGIALNGHDSRTIYWAWRIPGAVAPGAYRTTVTVTDQGGRILGTSEGASSTLTVAAR